MLTALRKGSDAPLASFQICRLTKLLTKWSAFSSMPELNTAFDNVCADGETVAPGIDSRFRLVIVAGRRTKQLLQGAEARVEVDQRRRKRTSIALEEVKRGLVRFRKSEKS